MLVALCLKSLCVGILELASYRVVFNNCFQVNQSAKNEVLNLKVDKS